MNDQTRLSFYASTAEPCSYLPNKKSISAFANPYMDMDTDIYNELIKFGFRRSGGYLYRPHCPDCNACISIRIQVDRHIFSRNDRKCLKRNQDLTLHTVDKRFSEEHFELYCRYINSRHKGGSMENPSRSDYHRFLISDWTESRFIELRHGEVLLAVAVTDITSSGLSAVYTFFDPQQTQRSLGHFAILKQIELTRQYGLPYLYLGYWIEQCDKMRYKTRYQPAEVFINESWSEFTPSITSKVHR